MLGSRGRPLSLLCHLLASAANYSFPRRGKVSALSGNAELRCSGWWKNPGNSGVSGYADTALCRAPCIPQSSHPHRSCTPVSVLQYRVLLCNVLARLSCTYRTLPDPYFSRACADFGWFFAGPWSCLCDVSYSGKPWRSGLTLGLYRLWRCACLFLFSSFPFEAMHHSQAGFITSWRRPPLFKMCAVHCIYMSQISIWNGWINTGVLLASAWYARTWSRTHWNSDFSLRI